MNHNKILKISIKVATVLLFLCIVLYLTAVSIYTISFNYRCETHESKAFSMDDFPTLKREKHSFESMQGHGLVGYLYESSIDVDKRALIVFAHGLGGGGQRGYIDIFNHLAQSGFYVFAYDATANDESEGKAIGGLPQGYIDLDYAITYAQKLEKTKNLPLVLMGYSWGGLSVTNVLNYHPEAKAVVSFAGWDRSIDIIDHVGRNIIGDKSGVLLPFVYLHEQLKYGKYASSTSMKGFERSDCRVMIVHGELDETIPIGYGYEKYYERYEGDPRFTFKKYDTRGHDVILDSSGSTDMELFSEVVDFINQSLD